MAPPNPRTAVNPFFFHQRWREEEAQGQGWRKEVRKKAAKLSGCHLPNGFGFVRESPLTHPFSCQVLEIIHP